MRSIRLVPELRAVHLTRYRETTPALLLYFTENYDLAGEDVPPEIRKVALRDLPGLFWRSECTFLEAPEPLWMRFLPRGAAIVALFKATGLLRGRRRRVGTYAMENNDLPTLIGGRRSVPALAVRLFSTALGLYMRLMIDRIVFASEGSRAVYTSIPGVDAIESTTIEELPTAVESDDADVLALSACFVGVLETRKGILALMEAWERVEQQLPTAHLDVVGPGEHADAVREWVDRAPATRRLLGQLPRHEVLSLLARTQVLAAPSLPDGRWREQIGLPIKEALSNGLTVVTTHQTGLAGWLRGHGHRVVELEGEGSLAGRLSGALIDALTGPLERPLVRASLPAVEGRYASDSWLHRERVATSAPASVADPSPPAAVSPPNAARG